MSASASTSGQSAEKWVQSLITSAARPSCFARSASAGAPSSKPAQEKAPPAETRSTAEPSSCKAGSASVETLPALMVRRQPSTRKTPCDLQPSRSPAAITRARAVACCGDNPPLRKTASIRRVSASMLRIVVSFMTAPVRSLQICIHAVFKKPTGFQASLERFRVSSNRGDALSLCFDRIFFTRTGVHFARKCSSASGRF